MDLDRVESQFRAAVKEQPSFEPPALQRVLLITDLAPAGGTVLENKTKRFLRGLGDDVVWARADRDTIDGVRSMLEHVEMERPDLIVTYRHLFEDDKDLPHSLGTYADMLTQAITTPVLLLPNPQGAHFDAKLGDTERVVVITNQIVGDQRLVSWGLRMVQRGGHLIMANVEDDEAFRRYLDVISKIPDLDTDIAERQIARRLIHEAEDFLDAWAAQIRRDFDRVEPETVIRLGHTTRDYIDIAREAEADLVVFNTRDKEQLAMHGVAYALAVELLDIPLLML